MNVQKEVSMTEMYGKKYPEECTQTEKRRLLRAMEHRMKAMSVSGKRNFWRTADLMYAPRAGRINPGSVKITLDRIDNDTTYFIEELVTERSYDSLVEEKNGQLKFLKSDPKRVFENSMKLTIETFNLASPQKVGKKKACQEWVNKVETILRTERTDEPLRNVVASTVDNNLSSSQPIKTVIQDSNKICMPECTQSKVNDVVNRVVEKKCSNKRTADSLCVNVSEPKPKKSALDLLAISLKRASPPDSLFSLPCVPEELSLRAKNVLDRSILSLYPELEMHEDKCKFGSKIVLKVRDR
ncbi:unnamed protein product, partial [Allacma fusca]